MKNLLIGTQKKVSYVDTNATGANNSTNSNQTIGSDEQNKENGYNVIYAVEILASQNTGIEIDSSGKPISSIQDIRNKFYAECNRLRKNEDKIKAAAAANLSVDRDGNPIKHNMSEETAYDRAYELLFGDKPTNGEKSSNKIYVSPKGAEVSSGKIYTTKDILSLNGSTVFVVNDGDIEMGENVTVNIDEELAEIIMATSNEFNIDPTLIIAVMAHESRFKPDVSSGVASGLMQVNNNYFPTYASENKELIESLGGDYTNIYDKAANIVAWGAAYQVWVNKYGDNKDSLKALRQGNKGSGWTIKANDNANEFMDIKEELDNMIK